MPNKALASVPAGPGFGFLGRPGDQVYLQTTRNGQVVFEGQVTLRAGGAIRFDVTAPKLDRWYVVQLPATDAHAAAQVRVLVKAGPAS